MDKHLHAIVVNVAARKAGLTVTPSFPDRIDAYMNRADVSRLPDAKKRIVAAFLCSAAINIARKDHKSLLEGEDAKAALWLYHFPKDEFDECVQASVNILKAADADEADLQLAADAPMRPRMVKLEDELQAWVIKGQELEGRKDIEELGAG